MTNSVVFLEKIYLMIIRQSFTLLRQNPFFSVVSIIGTAVSIAFAMVVYMVYDIQTANIRPESHRDRMVYSSYGYSYRKADHSNANTLSLIHI